MKLNKLNDISVPYFKEILFYLIPIIILYIYIFQPPIINKMYYVFVQSLILGVYGFLDKKFFKSIYTNLKYELLLLFFIIIYCLVRDLFTGEIVYFDRFLVWSFQSVIIGYLFLYHFYKKKNYKIDLINLLYWTSFIASIFTALLIFIKPFDSFYESIQMDSYYERYENFEFRYRAYGISENLTFTYSFVLGIFGGYTLLVIRKNILLVFPMLLFILGVFFNARIGFIFITLFILIFHVKFKLKQIVKTYFYIIIALFFIVCLVQDQIAQVFENSTWALQFFYEISDSVFGTNYVDSDKNTINTLTQNFIIFPETIIETIFGTGESIYLRKENNSDVGYILQLYYGGLILIFLMFSLIYYMSWRLKLSVGTRHWYFMIFIISIIILNFKGFIFAATPGGRILFFIYIYYICFYSKRKKINLI